MTHDLFLQAFCFVVVLGWMIAQVIGAAIMFAVSCWPLIAIAGGWYAYLRYSKRMKASP